MSSTNSTGGEDDAVQLRAFPFDVKRVAERRLQRVDDGLSAARGVKVVTRLREPDGESMVTTAGDLGRAGLTGGSGEAGHADGDGAGHVDTLTDATTGVKFYFTR